MRSNSEQGRDPPHYKAEQRAEINDRVQLRFRKAEDQLLKLADLKTVDLVLHDLLDIDARKDAARVGVDRGNVEADGLLDPAGDLFVVLFDQLGELKVKQLAGFIIHKVFNDGIGVFGDGLVHHAADAAVKRVYHAEAEAAAVPVGDDLFLDAV